MVDRVGQQLGNYRLLRLLGKGGFAEVYLGEHVYLKTRAAIKLLQTRVGNAEDLDSFLKEAQTIAHLFHRHIVRVMDFGVDGETPFLVMDYAPNGSLRQLHPKGTRLPLASIIPYTQQIASALQYAHDEKLIHRDVKPENMLVGRDHDVLLSDFGIALIAQSSRNQSTQEVIGTATYMSPEQIRGKPRPASDQYALGVVVYEWLCGTPPFEGSLTELWSQHIFASPPPLHEKVPTIPRAIEQVVMKALAKEPTGRFPTIQLFASALERVSHTPAIVSAKPVTPTQQTTPGRIAPQQLYSEADQSGQIGLQEAQSHRRTTPSAPSTQQAPRTTPVPITAQSKFFAVLCYLLVGASGVFFLLFADWDILFLRSHATQPLLYFSVVLILLALGFGGVFFLLFAKKDKRFWRYNAAGSSLTFGIILVFCVLREFVDLTLGSIPLLGWVVVFLVSLLTWIVLIIALLVCGVMIVQAIGDVD